MSDATTDNEFVVEIDLGEMDWSTPAAWEDSPLPEAPAEAMSPEPEVIPPPATEAETTPATEAITSEAVEFITPLEPETLKTPEPEQATEPEAVAPSEAVALSEAVAPPSKAVAASATPSLPPAFAEVVAGVEPASLRELVGSTFARLLRALETLGVIEKALTRPRAVRVGLLFEDVRGQSVSLLSKVTEAVSNGVALERRHREALDGLRFVIGHELTKVFRQEFPGLTDENGPTYSRADLSRAWGLLHNCLQQTAITLAQALSPGVSGERLFEDYKHRVESSFALFRELNVLLRKVCAAEGSSGILLKHSLVRHLEHFREETMRLLMYRDWGEFGRYADDVKRAFEEMEEFEPVLHEFSQYLRTLIHHVGMREALRGATPEDYEEDAE